MNITPEEKIKLFADCLDANFSQEERMDACKVFIGALAVEASEVMWKRCLVAMHLGMQIARERKATRN